MEQPYPSKAEIAAMFSDLANGNTSALFSQVSPQVDWEVIGGSQKAGVSLNHAHWHLRQETHRALVTSRRYRTGKPALWGR